MALFSQREEENTANFQTVTVTAARHNLLTNEVIHIDL